MTKYKIALMSLLAVTAGAAHATVVDFATGYSDGDLLDNSNWEQYTTTPPADGGNIVSTTDAGYAGLGTVTLTNEQFSTSTFTEDLSFGTAGDSVTAKYRFRYTGAGTPSSQGEIISANLHGDPLSESNDGAYMTRVAIRRAANTGNLAFFTSGASGGITFATGSESLTGIVGGTGTSDWLELSITLTRNSATGTDDFTLEATLENLNSSSEVLTGSINNFEPVTNVPTYSSLRGQISSGWRPSVALVSDVTVDQFEVTSTNVPVFTITSIIKGSLGNGDFEANTNSGIHTVLETPDWYQAGWDGNGNFTREDNTNTTRRGQLNPARVNINGIGRTVLAAGEEFNLSYTLYKFGGAAGFTGDETNRTYLFTSDVDVDNDTNPNDMTTVAGSEYFYVVDTNNFTQPVNAAAFYTTTTADIGKTFYLAVQYQDPSVASYPRVDNIILTASEPPPVLNLINGAISNGDFEANTNSGLHTVLETPNWYQAGWDGTAVFTREDNTNTTRRGQLNPARININDGGRTVEKAGEIFNLSYTLYKFGGAAGYTGDETNRTWLFTSDVAVDNDTTPGNMTMVAGSENLYAINSSDFTQPVTQEEFYTTTEDDIGKTFYLAVQYEDPSVASYPRFDNVILTVSGNISLTPPPPSYDTWALENGLTIVNNDKTDNPDMDTLNNWEEYIFGGLPLDDSDIGILPTFDGSNGDYAFSIRGDTNLQYSVLITSDLVFGSWTTNGPTAVTEHDGFMHAETYPVGTGGSKQFIKLLID